VYPALSIGSVGLPYLGVTVAAGATYYFRQAIDGVAPLSAHWKTSHRMIFDGWLMSFTDGAAASDLNCYISVLDDMVGFLEVYQERVQVLPLLLDQRIWINNLQINGEQALFRIENTTAVDASLRGWLRVRGV